MLPNVANLRNGFHRCAVRLKREVETSGMAKDAMPIEVTRPRDGMVFVEMATEVVSAYLAGNRIAASEIPGLIAAVHAAFIGLAKSMSSEPAVIRPRAPVPVGKTIADGHLISLEDGKPYKALKRHLRKLGLTPEAYRIKWGLPFDYPMVSPAYARDRSRLAKGMGFGTAHRKP